ncbi:hypothetical protein [Thauera linaloolentis]|uniref:hypothetical protein n=1 Tax=Thauera linaloolentis TaxID=76112 RepID=UPI0012B53A2C|nr:hypothetical protein [Thauera linaloolentis]MCM8565129.1 hypothetical protein [Thauera linaloolentis]
MKQKKPAVAGMVLDLLPSSPISFFAALVLVNRVSACVEQDWNQGVPGFQALLLLHFFMLQGR